MTEYKYNLNKAIYGIPETFMEQILRETNIEMERIEEGIIRLEEDLSNVRMLYLILEDNIK